jgi:drug/metabolite transporter (DMT)-like permease
MKLLSLVLVYIENSINKYFLLYMYPLVYLLSDTMISFYGVLIKKYNTIPISQHLLIRSLVFVILSSLFLGEIPKIERETVFLSTINLLSITGIFIAFKYLDIGIANSLFYTWPILYYLITIPILRSHKFSLKQLGFLLALLSSSTLVLYKKSNHTNLILGLLGVITAVLTHITTIVYYKTDTSVSIHKYLNSQYLIMLVILIGYNLINYRNINLGSENLYLILYNLIIGYLAFYMNFYSIKHIENYKLSSITFLTIVITFILGYLFLGEKTNYIQWIGIILISLFNYISYTV